MSFDLDTLYKLLPAIYRIRDLQQLSGDTSLLGQAPDTNQNKFAMPLQALMEVLGEQIAVLEENLAQLYDDQFIETCADWAIPYIGELVGYTLPLDTSSQSLRSEVANTIRYRKRKGTITLLEQLVRDVTGWDVHVVEYFQLLATSQHLQRLRPENSLIDVRQIASPKDIYPPSPIEKPVYSEDVYPPSPFEKLVHTVDVRNIATGDGRYNIANIGIFIWRLQDYRLSNVPLTQAPIKDRNRYLYFFNPLGSDLQLFTHPQHEENVTQPGGPPSVAAPISRTMLARAFSDYYGPNKSFWFSVPEKTSDGHILNKPILPDTLELLIEISNALYFGLTSGRLDFQQLAQLSKALSTGLTTLETIDFAQRAQLIDWSETLATGLATIENLDFQTLAGLITKSQKLFDGLKALSKETDEFTYPFTICDLSDLTTKETKKEDEEQESDEEAEDGKEEQESDKDKSGWKPSPKGTIAIDPVLGRVAFPKRRKGQRKNVKPLANLQATFSYGFSADMGGGGYHRGNSFTQGLQALQQVLAKRDDVQKALDALATPMVDGVVEIIDNGRMEGILQINAGPNQRIELRAENFKRPLLVLADKKGKSESATTGDQGATNTPALAISGDEGAEVTMNGLVISHGPIRVTGKLHRLTISHCTLVPRKDTDEQGKAQEHSLPALICESNDTTIVIDHSIVGRLEVKGNVKVQIANSIVDAINQKDLAYAGPPAFSSEDVTLDTLSIENSTIIGRVHTTVLELASNTIFYTSKDENEAAVPVQVERRQEGCVRYSYLPDGSQVPQRRYSCQPEKDGDAQAIELYFTSRTYGDASYCQLSQRTSQVILSGADDKAEMGAFHDLFQPQRTSNLNLRLREYLRFGFETGIFYRT